MRIAKNGATLSLMGMLSKNVKHFYVPIAEVVQQLFLMLTIKKM